jgi:protein gp37
MGFRPIAIWLENGWMDVSVEDERVVHCINSLCQTSAIIKFRSLEPLIGPLPPP